MASVPAAWTITTREPTRTPTRPVRSEAADTVIRLGAPMSQVDSKTELSQVILAIRMS